MLKKLLKCFLVLVLMGSINIYAQGTQDISAQTEQTPAKTNNWGTQNYRTYGTTVKSYLFDNGDDTVTRVEFDGTQINVEVYDSEFAFISRQVLPMELSIFGGFYE